MYSQCLADVFFCKFRCRLLQNSNYCLSQRKFGYELELVSDFEESF